jgi:geranylgeranyl transferase type-2 subunit alpha
LTSKVLNLNPEYYTVWNQRRKILQNLFADTSEDDEQKYVQGLLSTELQFLLPLLMKFPKCYWIWNHRYWTLKQVSEKLDTDAARNYWNQELGLVGKMLGRDSRNFHGWDYRRFVIAELRKLAKAETKHQAGSTDEAGEGTLQDKTTSMIQQADQSITESEYAYTTKMIKSNLSNFSAWHNRSKLIPRLLDERQADQQARRKLFDEELTLIQSAVFTDPYDQSLWYYHQFLMSELGRDDGGAFVQLSISDRSTYLNNEIDAIRDLLEDTDDCKWVYQSLLLYTSQYLELDSDRKPGMNTDMGSWLAELRKLDPMRSTRWDDWQKSLDLK